MAENLADVMTRVPVAWVRHCRETQEGDAIPVAAASVPPPVSMAEIVEAQASDPEIQAAIARVLEQLPLTGRCAAVGSQLEVSDGVLFRSVKLPVCRRHSPCSSHCREFGRRRRCRACP